MLAEDAAILVEGSLLAKSNTGGGQKDQQICAVNFAFPLRRAHPDTQKQALLSDRQQKLHSFARGQHGG